MSDAVVRRIRRELAYIREDESLGMSLTPDLLDVKHMIATIPGPADTPYEGGIFRIDIVVPDDYPFKPPKIRFITKVWNPKICSRTGAICLDMLNDRRYWSPVITLKAGLLLLQVLLSSPEPSNPQDAVVARQYTTDYVAFIRTARHWTKHFAMPLSSGFNEKVQKLVKMGFRETMVKATLEAVSGDELMAVEELCSLKKRFLLSQKKEALCACMHFFI